MELPTGTVTFLFTDIEGSTALARSLGELWPRVLEEHNRILRQAIRDNHGLDLRTEGDAFFAVFTSAVDAVAAAASAQRLVADHPWPPEGPVRVRMGMHTGEGRLGGDEYVGLDVHRAARIAGAGHGGQVLLSEATRVLVAEALPAGLALRSLGNHRLKDFEEPQPIHQLVFEGLPSDFPAIRTLEVPTNLPPELTSFVGRGPELRDIRQLAGEHRLVTLTGPGGTGKTRLVLRAARELLDGFPDGVVFVDLSPLDDPALVPSIVAGAADVRKDPDRPILETLKEHLRDKVLLLVLDNFEQVLDAGPAVSELLATAPSLKALVTSRAPLHLRGEQEYAVPPLVLPDPSQHRSAEGLAGFEAVALFVQRARAVEPGFALTDENAAAVAEVCARLDGLPLAIELAASRTRLLSPEALLERLERRLPLLTGGARDAPARQRTLRSTIEWSYELLDDSEQALFRRLGVFAGGWTLEATEAVAGPKEEVGLDLLGGLESLIDKSLVVRDSGVEREARFRMLETIREFALDRLEQRDDAEDARRAHAMFFLSLAERAEPELMGSGSTEWLGRLAEEHDNMRAALRWSVGSGQAELGLRLGAALWRFWHFRDHLSEGRGWMAQLLALPGAEARTAVRARAVSAAGSLAYWQNDYGPAGLSYEESLGICRDIEDPRGVADATYNLAYIRVIEGRYEEARRLYADARVRLSDLGDEVRAALTRHGMGFAAFLQGDYDMAVSETEAARRELARLGNPFGLAMCARVLGDALLGRGQVDEARSRLHESVTAFSDLGIQYGVAAALDSLAVLASRQGRHEVAVRLAGAADRLREAIKGGVPPQLTSFEDVREVAGRAMAPEAVGRAWEEGRSMSSSQAIEHARLYV